METLHTGTEKPVPPADANDATANDAPPISDPRHRDWRVMLEAIGPEDDRYSAGECFTAPYSLTQEQAEQLAAKLNATGVLVVNVHSNPPAATVTNDVPDITLSEPEFEAHDCGDEGQDCFPECFESDAEWQSCVEGRYDDASTVQAVPKRLMTVEQHAFYLADLNTHFCDYTESYLQNDLRVIIDHFGPNGRNAQVTDGESYNRYVCAAMRSASFLKEVAEMAQAHGLA